MFILPFLYKKLSNTPIHSVQFFLSKGGSALLSASYDPLLFCKENDIPVLRTIVTPSILFIEVDASALEKGVFYSYNEENTQSLEVWRTFVWVGSPTVDPWNVNAALEKVTLSGSKVSGLMEAVLRNVAYT